MTGTAAGPPYRDRTDAGERLAAAVLAQLARDPVPLVLALPRGGVPVAAPVAAALFAPLDVYVVRKLGVPGRRELAMGAIASGGVQVLNEDVVRDAAVSEATLRSVVEQESEELRRRELAYRGARPPAELAGRQVVLVDDGLATGASMRVAVLAVRAHDPARVVVAVPVGPAPTLALLRAVADEVVCPVVPAWFASVGSFYEDFRETSDEEVRRLLGS